MAGNEALVESGRVARGIGLVLWRRLPRILVGLAVVWTALGVFALAGAVRDDMAISANEAVATADVVSGSGFGRTLVRFPTPDGQLRVPERGVYYPQGLAAGTQVQVEYDRAEPDLVRVAGRTALGQVPQLLGVVAVGWLVFGGAAWGLARSRRPRSGDGEAQAVHQE